MAEASVRSVGAVDLAVLEAGRGGRPLLLVHGFTGAKEDFADHLDALAAEGWWVVAPDLRGHGASTQPPLEADYALATFAADLVGLVDGLGWERFALLGHSMGGMIAQELVLDHPDRVDRLVLMATDHGPVEGLEPEVVAVGLEVLRTQGLPALLALLDELAIVPRAASEERVRAERPGYVEFAERKARSCAPAMYAAMAVALTNRPDRLAELRGLAVPTLVLVGEEDRTFIGACRRLADAVPGATLAVIPNASHSPQFEHPEAWWRVLAPWLRAERLVG